MQKRNLCVAAMKILSRKLHSSSRLSTNLEPKLQSSRIFSCSFYCAGESRVSKSSSGNIFLAHYRRNVCSLDENTGRCWNSGVVAVSKPFLSCDSCKSVQPVHTSKKLHPDLVHMKSKEEKEFAAEQSSWVIDAYRTLRKPLSRVIDVLLLLFLASKASGVHDYKQILDTRSLWWNSNLILSSIKEQSQNQLNAKSNATNECGSMSKFPSTFIFHLIFLELCLGMTNLIFIS
ncbi:hypothetical protein MKW98_031436 [Papaver atlanticum]|uniref:Uncharacterized protein n=1 Tax=Papaver atlanticum TaxID=357466 RepID=A0AAD4X9B4_9MAGN|nr:hypothetical protein MKW98_031436 [Papaver atlanticum]